MTWKTWKIHRFSTFLNGMCQPSLNSSTKGILLIIVSLQSEELIWKTASTYVGSSSSNVLLTREWFRARVSMFRGNSFDPCSVRDWTRPASRRILTSGCAGNANEARTTTSLECMVWPNNFIVHPFGYIFFVSTSNFCSFFNDIVCDLGANPTKKMTR